MKVIVIGSGIVGGSIARNLRNQEIEVVVIDSKEEFSASKCSSGFFKESWIPEDIRQKCISGFDFLEEIGQMELVKLNNLDNNTAEEFFFVDWHNLAIKPDIVAKVKKVKNNKVFLEGGKMLEADNVVIACGSYTNKVLADSSYTTLPMDGYYGSVLLIDEFLDDPEKLGMILPMIKTWAPYKQFLAYVEKGRYKCSDGTKIKNIKTQDERVTMVDKRLMTHVEEIIGKVKESKMIRGIRPYMQKGRKNDYIHRCDDNLWSVTGTAKDSTAVSGYIAKQMFENLTGYLQI